MVRIVNDGHAALAHSSTINQYRRQLQEDALGRDTSLAAIDDNTYGA